MVYKESFIEDELNISHNLDEFILTMKNKFSLLTKEARISDERVVLVTRPEGFKNHSRVSNEATIIVLNESWEIVNRSIDKVQIVTKYNKAINNFAIDRQIDAEALIPGILLTVTEHKDNILISTKHHIMGKNTLPKSDITIREYFLKKMKELNPEKGAKILFDDIVTSPVSWSFILCPNKNEYDLYLIHGIDLQSLNVIKPVLLDRLSDRFKTNRPARVLNITNTDNLISLTNNLVEESNSKINGIIFIDDNCNRIKIKYNKNVELRLLTQGLRRRIEKISAFVINEIEYDVLVYNDTETENITNYISKLTKNLLISAEILYNTYIDMPTRKQFSKRIKLHPMSRAIFALRDKKIRNIKEIGNILGPKELLRILYRIDNKTLIKEINKSRKIYDRKKDRMV